MMDAPSALRQWAGADPARARPAGLARIARRATAEHVSRPASYPKP
jgi:hypothetical protein